MATAPPNLTAEEAARAIARLPGEQASLVRELALHDQPINARTLADATGIDRRSAGQRLRALTQAGLVTSRAGRGPRLDDRVHVYMLTGSAGAALAREALAAEPAAPTGPIVYATLMSERTRGIESGIRSQIQPQLAQFGEGLISWLTPQLAAAYAAGAADGFAQGVAAEAERHQTESIAA